MASNFIFDSLENRALLTAAPAVAVTNLVSSNTTTIPAAFQGGNLVNPWGLAAEPPPTDGSPTDWWVANNGTGFSIVYQGTGFSEAFSVGVVGPDGNLTLPTGEVYYGGSQFTVGKNEPSEFIFDSEDGTISGWHASANPSSIVKVDDSASGAVFKGLAIGTDNGHTFLYAADFRNNKVDVIDSNFQPAHLSGSFKDKKIPKGYAPFGIQQINGLIYVTYAPQAKGAHDQADGPGFGAVDVFNPDGSLLHRLIRGGTLNAPWGLAMAPGGFGSFSHKLLVGNFGDGRIQAFDPTTGQFLGYLKKTNGKKVGIDGLWALQFGNGGLASNTNQLFFTAGPDDESEGLFGVMNLGKPKKAKASSTASGGGIVYPMSATASGLFSSTTIKTSDILTGATDPSTV